MNFIFLIGFIIVSVLVQFPCDHGSYGAVFVFQFFGCKKEKGRLSNCERFIFERRRFEDLEIGIETRNCVRVVDVVRNISFFGNVYPDSDTIYERKKKQEYNGDTERIFK